MSEQKVRDQIEGRTKVRVHFTDAKPENLSIYKQAAGLHFIKPLFHVSKEISKIMYFELFNQIENGEINNGMTYDDFFEKYYNTI